jgi:hypothetical protein
MSVLLTIAGHCTTFHDRIEAAANSLQTLLGQVQLLHNGIELSSTVDETDVAGFSLVSSTMRWLPGRRLPTPALRI